MLTRTAVFLLAFFIVVPCGSAKEIAGISLSDTHELSQETLILNGAGIRKKLTVNLDYPLDLTSFNLFATILSEYKGGNNV